GKFGHDGLQPDVDRRPRLDLHGEVTVAATPSAKWYVKIQVRWPHTDLLPQRARPVATRRRTLAPNAPPITCAFTSAFHLTAPGPPPESSDATRVRSASRGAAGRIR